MDAVRIRHQTPLFYGTAPPPRSTGRATCPSRLGDRMGRDVAGPAPVSLPGRRALSRSGRSGDGTRRLAATAGWPASAPQFDPGRANKLDKFDLESACVVPTEAGERLLLVGSGSLPVREVLLEIDLIGGGQIRVDSTASFCDRLREHEALRGAELNLEGACVTDSDLVLLQRGNGVGARNAVIRVALDEFGDRKNKRRRPFPPRRQQPLRKLAPCGGGFKLSRESACGRTAGILGVAHSACELLRFRSPAACASGVKSNDQEPRLESSSFDQRLIEVEGRIRKSWIVGIAY